MKYLFFLCFCFSLTTGSGQGVGALLRNREKAKTDSLKIAAYQAIVKHYRYTNFDSALLYAKEGLAYAQRNAYALGEGTMINALGQVNERHGFLDVAKTQYKEALSIFSSIGFKKGIAATTNGLGVIAGRTGKYDEATRYFLEALELFEQIDETYGVVQTYIKLGVVSDHLGNLEKALEYYLKAEALNTEPASSNASLSLLNNIGIIYGRRNDIPTALKYFHKGLKASDPKQATGIHIALLGSLGIAYEKSGHPDSSWYYQQQALSLARQNNLPEEEARALLNLAELVRKTDPDQSRTLLSRALQITERIQQLKLMSEVYEALIVLYKDQNDFKEALRLTEKRQLLTDSLFSLEKSKEIANLHATHELARQENEIRNLAVLNEKSMFQRNIMIVIALIAIAMIGIVWYFNTKISNLNIRLIAKQHELENSNTIKDKLFSVLGHDLRTPLSQVIGLLSVLGTNQKTSDESLLIDKLRQQSINTLETLDNLLLWGQSQLKGIRLNQQTIRVKEQIRKSLHLTGDGAAEKNVKLIDHTPQELLVCADPSHFDLVMRNLLSNAIKFSHSGGAVVIDAHASGKEVVVSIKDSGVGMTKKLQHKVLTPGNESIPGTWNEKGTGIGLMLCQEYVAENGGRLWMESEPGAGATFYFSLKQQQALMQPQQETVPA